MSPDPIGKSGISRLGPGRRMAVACAVAVAMACILGCGMKGAPEPPSLHLPKPVSDLTAVRVGDQVDLRWETPRETTDRLRIRKPVDMRICRRISTQPCRTVATTIADPDKAATYHDTLPAALTVGPLRAIQYQVFAVNRHGRSAAPSNSAPALAGAAPPPVEGLAATTVPRGVRLDWRPPSQRLPDTSVRLLRTLVTPPKRLPKPAPSALPPVSEPTEQVLKVPSEALPSDSGAVGVAQALDATARFGRTYRYRATRVTAVTIGKLRLQAESAPSAAVTILTRDTFPPAAPTGLVAVAVSAAMNHGIPAVDLSWLANTELDLAGYIVYRRELSGNGVSSPAERIAPAKGSATLTAPAFRDLHVQTGRTYAYSVTALDQAGNESAPSAEVTVTVPSS